MRYIKIYSVLILLLLLAAVAIAAEKTEFQFKKQPELQQLRPKKPVRIKLRRSPKSEYTWELAGDDADEIVRTDRKLRKMLNVQ
jgi:predicted secreted protein